MRSGIHGTFATLLLMVPVLSIPALAIFGIPQFAPVVASPLDEGRRSDQERRVGQSAKPVGDRFAEDPDDALAFGSEPTDRRSSAPSARPGESVPWPRPGRNSSNRTSPIDAPESRFDNTNPHGANDGAEVPNPGSAFDKESFGPRPNERSNDRSNRDARDNPFDSNQSAPPEFRPPQFKGVPTTGSGSPPNPRAFQRQPEPLPNVDAKDRSAGTENEPLTWQTAVRRLNEMEIRNFRLQPSHRENQFVFICSYSSSDSPRVSRRFEAEADEPLKAVEKVLEQIAEWKQRR